MRKLSAVQMQKIASDVSEVARRRYGSGAGLVLNRLGVPMFKYASAGGYDYEAFFALSDQQVYNEYEGLCKVAGFSPQGLLTDAVRRGYNPYDALELQFLALEREKSAAILPQKIMDAGRSAMSRIGGLFKRNPKSPAPTPQAPAAPTKPTAPQAPAPQASVATGAPAPQPATPAPTNTQQSISNARAIRQQPRPQTGPHTAAQTHRQRAPQQPAPQAAPPTQTHPNQLPRTAHNQRQYGDMSAKQRSNASAFSKERIADQANTPRETPTFRQSQSRKARAANAQVDRSVDAQAHYQQNVQPRAQVQEGQRQVRAQQAQQTQQAQNTAHANINANDRGMGKWQQGASDADLATHQLKAQRQKSISDLSLDPAMQNRGQAQGGFNALGEANKAKPVGPQRGNVGAGKTRGQQSFDKMSPQLQNMNPAERKARLEQLKAQQFAKQSPEAQAAYHQRQQALQPTGQTQTRTTEQMQARRDNLGRAIQSDQSALMARGKAQAVDPSQAGGLNAKQQAQQWAQQQQQAAQQRTGISPVVDASATGTGQMQNRGFDLGGAWDKTKDIAQKTWDATKRYALPVSAVGGLGYGGYQLYQGGQSGAQQAFQDPYGGSPYMPQGY